MGYRLDINKIDLNETDENKFQNIYYGTKLYGYDLDLDKSLSYEFLKTINKMNGDEYFDYGSYNETILNYNELILFLKLYNIDYNNYGWNKDEKDSFINQEEIQDLLLNVGKYEDYNFSVGWI